MPALLSIGVLAAACGGADAPELTPEPSPSVVATVTPDPTPDPRLRPYPAGSVGYAISWPQCGADYPEEPFDFGIVGVTDGRAFTRNGCFRDEYEWALHGKYHPSIYMNTNFVAADSDTIVQGRCHGLMTCQAYEYGWAAAADAYHYAESLHLVSRVWWLDVQTASEWSEDRAVNVQSVLGAGDFLRAQGISVGISSTWYQWAEVAGDAPHHMPIWDASATDAQEAREFCDGRKDFAGGKTEQIAYVETFETVVACGPGGRP